jgi:hypothetical protein
MASAASLKLCALVLGVPLALAGCVEETATTTLRTGSSAVENACLSAVARETGTSVTLLSSDHSEANTAVLVGVGPQLAPWRCQVSGGSVCEVMSMNDEGAA